MEGLSVLIFACALFSILMISTAQDTISATQSIRDGESETIVSAGGTFELGFFSPGNSKNRYLGIRYKKISSMNIVWIANRETPLTDTSGGLNLTDGGILILLNSTNSIIWSSNSSRISRNPVAQLLESGNLVIKDGNDDNPENFIWQSFDYPGDTFLPDMKFGRNRVTGLDRYLTSWKSPDDPSQGNYTYRFEFGGFPELYLRKGSDVQFRSGPWNGLRFSGTPGLKQNLVYTFSFVFNGREMYYRYELLNSSVVSRMVLTQNGLVQRFTWIDRTQDWALYLTAQTDNCDTYALCGAYGSCNINNSPSCDCLKGFVPKSPKDWNRVDWSNGCIRKTPLNCSGDGFLQYSGVKLPDTRHSWYNGSMGLEECKMVCTNNCNCTAYANSDIRGGGSGCFLWFGDLLDIRYFTENGQDIYIRMAASELDSLERGNGTEANNNGNEKNPETNANNSVRKPTRVILISLLSAGMLILSLTLVWYLWKKKHKRNGKKQHNPETTYTNDSQKADLELPLFDMATIADATNNFSFNNIIGEGGFGSVFKGILKDGQEIAVKRLSKDSRQGIDEFKNEVMHIAKLQHRNLVKLLGCCIQEDEKMLIYEFMPHKSLDYFIFDQTRSMLLDWRKRFHIINGTARGLLYLHQDSRLRIIHRDLKAGNVLLDVDMNPKISDFGLARSFGEKETGANTKKVVGTYGYMSPEYAIDGLYSIKSDVFSFGVLVLEILSGKRNRGFHHPDHYLNLLGHAWRLYTEGRPLELIDESLGDSVDMCNMSQMLRSIHVGLLCVQRSPEDRPTMSSVVLMLGSDGALPQPKQPGFFTERDLFDASSTSSKKNPYSANEFTITLVDPR